jgi:hypothetical protein
MLSLRGIPMMLANARYEVPREGDAGRLIEALCEVPLDRWYAAALAIAADPRREQAEQALDLALRSADPLLLWHAHDDLDTALFRLTSPASESPLSAPKRDLIRSTTRRAVAALVCSGSMEQTPLLILTSPLMELIDDDGRGRAAPRGETWFR